MYVHISFYVFTWLMACLFMWLNYRYGYHRATRRAAHLASMFTAGPNASLHPDVPWEQTSLEAKMIAHITAQQIALLIIDDETQMLTFARKGNNA